MTLIGFLVLLLIAAVCGGIGQSLAGYDLGGCLVSIIVGFIGAYIGLWVAAKMGFPRIFEINIDGKPFPVVWAVIGSAIFTLIIGLLRRLFLGGRRDW
ncbi:MAG: GlsB/YeaQ/YmgE family stress response membrane protein [Segetibacter sp.]